MTFECDKTFWCGRDSSPMWRCDSELKIRHENGAVDGPDGSRKLDFDDVEDEKREMKRCRS